MPEWFESVYFLGFLGDLFGFPCLGFFLGVCLEFFPRFVGVWWGFCLGFDWVLIGFFWGFFFGFLFGFFWGGFSMGFLFGFFLGFFLAKFV